MTEKNFTKTVYLGQSLDIYGRFEREKFRYLWYRYRLVFSSVEETNPKHTNLDVKTHNISFFDPFLTVKNGFETQANHFICLWKL